MSQPSNLQSQQPRLSTSTAIESLAAEAMTVCQPFLAATIAASRFAYSLLKVCLSGKSDEATRHLEPPAWKRILAVVLGLYPIILLQDYVFDYLEILEDWPPASALLVKLLLSSCIFTFVVMPIISKRLDFWLQPASQSPSLKLEVVGVGSTLMIMWVVSLVFNALA